MHLEWIATNLMSWQRMDSWLITGLQHLWIIDTSPMACIRYKWPDTNWYAIRYCFIFILYHSRSPSNELSCIIVWLLSDIWPTVLCVMPMSLLQYFMRGTYRGLSRLGFKIIPECDICGSASERYLISVCLLMYVLVWWCPVGENSLKINQFLTFKHFYIRGKGH